MCWTTHTQPRASLSRAAPPAQAYADYNDLMAMTEEMVSGMVKELKGGYKITYHADGPDAEPVEIDFTPPWRRVSMLEALEEALGTELPRDLYSDDARARLDALCVERSIDCGAPRVRSYEFSCMIRRAIMPYQSCSCVHACASD